MTDKNTVPGFSRDEEPDIDPMDDVVARNDDVAVHESEHQADAQPAPVKRTRTTPVLLAVNWAMSTFAVLAVAVFLCTISNSMGSDEPQPWQVADTELQGTIESQVKGLKGEFTATVPSPTAATEHRYTPHEQAKSGMSDQNAALTARVARLEQSLLAFNERIARQDTQIAEIRREIVLAVQKYDRKWPELSADKDGTAPAAAPVKIAKAAQLPIHIVSIDLWDGKPQLTIRDNNHWRFLRVGDQHRGWTVVSADYGAGTVGLRDANNQLFSTMLPGRVAPVAQAANRPDLARPSGLPKLTVLTEPREASVKVLNIVPKYRDDMALPPGAYDILVKHAGYQPYRRWIRLGGRDRVLHVALVRK